MRKSLLFAVCAVALATFPIVAARAADDTTMPAEGQRRPPLLFPHRMARRSRSTNIAASGWCFTSIPGT